MKPLVFLSIVLLSFASRAQTSGSVDTSTASTEGVSLKMVKLYDSSRSRRVDVAVYSAPAAVKKNNEVVVLSHGYDPANEQACLSYSYIANFLSERGYLVLSVQHDLATDKTIPREGNLQVLRLPFWETGVENILFALQSLNKQYPGYSFKKVSLIGHSNGGDISALLATKYPKKVRNLITLDHRRVRLPRTRSPRVYTLRSSDLPADEDVLPDAAEKKKYYMTVIWLPNTKHNDMDDDATAEQKLEINTHILRFLSDGR